jgi:uncharacterized membrane protein YhhN
MDDLHGVDFFTVGDVFLLFEFMQPSFFIVGVGAFLLAHIFYISYFLRIKSYFGSFFKKQPWWLLLIYSYCFGLLLLIFPGLGAMEIPVTLYAIVLSAMLFSSVHVFLKVQSLPIDFTLLVPYYLFCQIRCWPSINFTIVFQWQGY